MTDDELKDLVAKIAVSQDRADVRQAEADARQARADARQDRADARQAEADARQNRADARQAEADARQAEADARHAKLDAKLDRLAEMYGGVGNSLGAVAEEFYYNSLKANPVLNGMRFDFIDKNITRSHAGLEDEFDLVLVNGRTVFVVEVKHKAHKKDLQRLLETKAVNFRRLFPEYADHEQRFVLAAFHIHDDIKRAALERGVTVLQRKGEVIESIAA